MRAGKLKHRITILIPAQTDAADGDYDLDYTDGPTVWGAIEPIAGREGYQAQQIKPEITHKITLRYRGGLTSRHGLRWNGRTFGIVPGISTDEGMRDLVLFATEAL